MRANEMALTDVRLEALTSAHQLDQMKELVCKMKVSEMERVSGRER